VKTAVSVLLIVATLNYGGHACTHATGYFHQVTAIKGRIVGKDLRLFSLRWLRQSFSVANATLTLYEYRSQQKAQESKRIAETHTDSDGRFDLGATPNGHYILDIKVKGSDEMGGRFDVEVTDEVGQTESLLIDVSPINPDCSGGLEFIERKAVNAQTH